MNIIIISQGPPPRPVAVSLWYRIAPPPPPQSYNWEWAWRMEEARKKRFQWAPQKWWALGQWPTGKSGAESCVCRGGGGGTALALPSVTLERRDPVSWGPRKHDTSSVGLMLVQHRRRWPNIKPTLDVSRLVGSFSDRRARPKTFVWMTGSSDSSLHPYGFLLTQLLYNYAHRCL